MKPLYESSLIVCGIVRNAEIGLKRNIPVVKELCKMAKDYRVVVYENDSKDDTKKLLESWRLTDVDKIFISMNDYGQPLAIPCNNKSASNPFFSKERIERMAELRNYYMDYINKQNWSADYLVVVDLDVAQLYLEGILSSFETKVEWDAVTSNGYSISPELCRRYHDTYALCLWNEQNNPQTEKRIKILADELGKLKSTDKWIRIASGFGGLAIYRFEAVKGIHYIALPNRDDRVEVKCEHFSIYTQMMERGFNRFYINPAMKLKYQELTSQIIWKSFKRRFLQFIS